MNTLEHTTIKREEAPTSFQLPGRMPWMNVDLRRSDPESVHRELKQISSNRHTVTVEDSERQLPWVGGGKESGQVCELVTWIHLGTLTASALASTQRKTFQSMKVAMTPRWGRHLTRKKRVHTALKKIPQKLSQQNQESRNLSKPERKISSNFLVSMFQ